MKRVELPHYIDRIEATRLLQEAHDGPLSDAQKAAVKRLNDLREAKRWGPDIIFKIFNDLDLLLFRGKLRGNVYLRWDNTSGPESKTLGSTLYSKITNNRCRITMGFANATKATVGLRDVLSTLIHEMVHAYLMILTRDDEGPSDKATDGHGNSFIKCSKAVMKRLGPGFKDIIESPGYDSRRQWDPQWSSGFKFDGKKEERPQGRRWGWRR